MESENSNYFSQLVETNTPILYRFAVKKTGNHDAAQDLVQDTLVKAYKSFDSFNSAKSKFSTWLCIIAHHLTIDALRKNSPSFVYLDDQKISLDLEAHRSYSPDYDFRSKELGRAIDNALESLPEEYRTPLVMREINGSNYDDIAKSLNIPLGTLKSHIHRGREIIRKSLVKHL